MLPSPVVDDKPDSLAARNLLRAWRMGLPSGQSVAKRMGVVPLGDAKILIGKAEDGVTGLPSITSISDKFKGNCPLWTYILAEAMQNVTSLKIPVAAGSKITEVNTPQLGPVGGRIVAEVFLGLWHGDKSSMLSLDPAWQPPGKPDYALKDFVAYALGL